MGFHACASQYDDEAGGCFQAFLRWAHDAQKKLVRKVTEVPRRLSPADLLASILHRRLIGVLGSLAAHRLDSVIRYSFIIFHLELL